MSVKAVLVTGGAGFIGSHVVDLLLEKGYAVRILDKLVEQVHKGQGGRYISPDAELLVGDMRDKKAVARALEGMDAVINLAAEVGVGQSMAEIVRYMGGNTCGTAVMLELLASGAYDVKRMIVASSMSVYGEGMYACPEHGTVAPLPRSSMQLQHLDWEVHCPQCQKSVLPVPTTEDKNLNPTSIYAISKLDQELMSLSIGRTYGIGTVALRLFNTYGPRQALTNPYTGVMAIFASQLLRGKAPRIFEDGEQLRGPIHVSDTAAAFVKALEAEEVSDTVCNIGTDQAITVTDTTRQLARALGIRIEPNITQEYRAGDIRHCWADTSRAKQLLGFEAQTSFAQGVDDLVAWVRSQKV